MAVPAVPTNFYLQQGNGQTFLSWDLTATATSYSVQRSTDGVSYSVLATPSPNYYLDTAVTVGTNYYYQVAAVNGSGTGTYTSAQSIVPTYSGDLALGQVRLMAQQRADRVNSNFVTLPEWNTYINQSFFELYDLLTTVYEDYYLADPVTFQTTATDTYALPNGLNYSGAKPFYKLLGVDSGPSGTSYGYTTLKKYDFIARNRFLYPQLGFANSGAADIRYRVLGDNIQFMPAPQAGQSIRLWYVPRMTQLLRDTDILNGISGWSEYVIVDAAIKALQKEESDVSTLMSQKMALKLRIEQSAQNRDAGQPDTISDIRSNADQWGGNGGFGGF